MPETILSTEGEFVVPITDLKIQIGLHYVHTHVCQVVGVEVNTLTGKIDILETEIFPTAGTVINRIGYEGQAEGASSCRWAIPSWRITGLTIPASR